MKPLFAMLALAGVAAGADVSGHYVLRGGQEVGSEMLLKPDGTFEYMLAYGAADYSAKGSWKLDGDAVVLNSLGQKAPPFRLVRSTASKTGGLCVSVKAPNGQPVPNIQAIAMAPQGKAEQMTDAQGTACFPDGVKATGVMLEVRVYGVEAGPFAVAPNRNAYEFEINGDAIMNVPFQNERLKLNAGGLELRYWDREKAMQYQKQ